MKIEILSRGEIDQIPLEQWRQLAKDSFYVNPFYEPWSLIPAIFHLDPEKQVSLVTAYENDRLVALFPVVLKSSGLRIRRMAMWKHSHCFLSDPLCLEHTPLGQIVDFVARQFSATVFQIKDHSPPCPAHRINRPLVCIRSARGAVFNTAGLMQHLTTLPRKQRLENARVKKRLLDGHEVSYKTSAEFPEIDWLPTFCALENAGWKGAQQGSIYSNSAVISYYSALEAEAKSDGRLQFQGLFRGSQCLAMSFRITTRNVAFELKTTYNEDYRTLYPGVVLELMNLEHLDDSGYEAVDSCTDPDNRLINRLWPDKKEVWNSFYFSDTSWGRALGKVLQSTMRLNSRLVGKP